jgi:competence protein ComEC
MRKDRVLFLMCLLYISGVFAGSFFVVAWWMIILFLALLVALATASFYKNVFLFILFCAVFVYGIFSVTNSLDKLRGENMRSAVVSGTARVINDPEEKNFYHSVILRMESCESAYCPREKILWRAPLFTDAVFGARVAFSCRVALPENVNAMFDYRMFLAKNGIGYVCHKAESAQILAEDVFARLGKWLFMPKHALVLALEKSLPQPEAGLAEGLLVGGDNHLPKTLKQAFVKTGLSHIVAISGYNIVLIAQGFVILGISIGLWRRQSVWFAAFGIIWFVILVGAQASAIRAGVMGTCAFAALFVGRLSRSINMLLFAAALMLVFQPLLLRYDIGFQLSFLASLAIIVFSPFMKRFISKEFFGKILIEIALLTFAVELLVVPLLAYQFQNFSPFALIANVLLLPLVPYAMLAAFVAGITFFVLPGLHILPSVIAYFFLRVITFAAEQISILPMSNMKVSVSATALIIWYLSLFLLIIAIDGYLLKRYAEAKNTF